MIEILLDKFKNKINKIDNSEALLIDADSWKEVSKFIKNDKEMKFDYLMSISSYDKEEGGLYGVAYNFHSTSLKHYLEIRIEVSSEQEIESIAHIWRAADWHEREAYDMMGIKFINHPDMKRILLPEDWEGYPLRKDYKTPNYYNGMPVPKDKSYWE